MYHFCHFVDLPRAAVRILSNMTFLFVSLSYTAESAIVTAFITFIPKFIESQFGIPASNASIYTGKALPLGLLVSMAVVSLGRNGGSGDGLECAASSCCPRRSLWWDVLSFILIVFIWYIRYLCLEKGEYWMFMGFCGSWLHRME